MVIEVTAKDLRQRYESLQNDELIDLYVNSKITEGVEKKRRLHYNDDVQSINIEWSSIWPK